MTASVSGPDFLDRLHPHTSLLCSASVVCYRQNSQKSIISKPWTSTLRLAANFAGTGPSRTQPTAGCGPSGLLFRPNLRNKAMLLRNDPEARIVPWHNGHEPVQSGAAGGSGREQESQLTADTLTDEQLELESPVHPLGIKPSGNKLLSTGTTDAREAIGAFQALPDGMATSVMSLVLPHGLLPLTNLFLFQRSLYSYWNIWIKSLSGRWAIPASIFSPFPCWTIYGKHSSLSKSIVTMS